MTPGRAPLIALLLLTLAAGVPPVARAQSIGDLADLFVRIAGRPEYSRTGTTGVQKWQKTLRYVVLGETRATMGPRVDGHMALMRSLTNLPVERIGPDGGQDAAERIFARGLGRFHVSAPTTAHDDAARMPVVSFANAGGTVRWRGNFFIFVGRRNEMAALTRGFGTERPDLARRIETGAVSCASVLHFAIAEHAIATAFVFLPTDMDAWRVERCVEEEITQSFGLMNDVRGSRLTLFDDDLRQRKTRLTAIDKLFLRALYDPRIRPGMNGSTLKAAAREVIGELRPR
ncbi:MAG: DUF2927 domain-containing protein [Reyranellaceae bacterium]